MSNTSPFGVRVWGGYSSNPERPTTRIVFAGPINLPLINGESPDSILKTSFGVDIAHVNPLTEAGADSARILFKRGDPLVHFGNTITPRTDKLIGLARANLASIYSSGLREPDIGVFSASSSEGLEELVEKIRNTAARSALAGTIQGEQ